MFVKARRSFDRTKIGRRQKVGKALGGHSKGHIQTYEMKKKFWMIDRFISFKIKQFLFSIIILSK